MKNPSPMISAVILAAGESQRMQTDKLNLPFRNSTVLGETLAIYENLADEIIVVTGKHRPPWVNHRTSAKVRWVSNAMAPEGPQTSLRVGLREVSPQSRAVIIAHGDMPVIRSSTVRQMMERLTAGAIVIPRYRGRKGHPVILDAAYIPECLENHRQMPLRELIVAHTPAVVCYDTDDEGILLDIDEWDDYHHLVRLADEKII